MNFNIIEGKTEERFPRFDEFCEDFFNPNLYVKDIKKKYGLSRNEYVRIRKKLVEKYNVQNKPTKFSPSLKLNNRAYIHKSGNKYTINKHIGGKKIYYGSYDSLETAKKVRDELIKHDWNKEMLEKILNQIRED